MTAVLRQAVRNVLDGPVRQLAAKDEDVAGLLERLKRGLNALAVYEARCDWLASRGCLAMVPLDKDLVDYASEAFGVHH